MYEYVSHHGISLTKNIFQTQKEFMGVENVRHKQKCYICGVATNGRDNGVGEIICVECQRAVLLGECWGLE